MSLPSETDAKRAIKQLSGSMMSERKISIQLSRDKNDDGPQTGSTHSSNDGKVMDGSEAEYESGEISDDSAMSIVSEPGVININLDGTTDHSTREEWRRRKDRANEDTARTPEGSPRRQGIYTMSDPLIQSKPALAPNLVTLAELDAEEVRKQLRYFHITRDPIAVDLPSTPAQCLKCASKGHMSDMCIRVTCQACGAEDDHSTESCPTPQHHSEPLWRTSRVSTEKSVNIQKIRLNCYECGLTGHLGNDCPTRRPGKEFGTSSWSLIGRNQTTQPVNVTGKCRIRAKAELKIKGGAKRQKPIYIEDESDNANDTAHFLGSKVRLIPRRGQIYIAHTKTFGPRSSERHNIGDRGSSSGRAYRRDEGGNCYRDRDARGYGEYNQGPDYGDDHRSHGRPGQFSQPNRFQPPLPNEPLPERGSQRGPTGNETRGGETYRPMPSSAASAWKKHLI